MKEVDFAELNPDDHISCDSCGAKPSEAAMETGNGGIWWNCKDEIACRTRYEHWCSSRDKRGHCVSAPSVFNRPPNAEEYIKNLRFGSPKGEMRWRNSG